VARNFHPLRKTRAVHCVWVPLGQAGILLQHKLPYRETGPQVTYELNIRRRRNCCARRGGADTASCQLEA
jgi:hypothetical protein